LVPCALRRLLTFNTKVKEVLTLVRFHILTGRPLTILPELVRRISAYTRQDRVQRFKIGIINHPQRRYSQAYADEYDEMIVVYEMRPDQSTMYLGLKQISLNTIGRLLTIKWAVAVEQLGSRHIICMLSSFAIDWQMLTASASNLSVKGTACKLRLQS
jgi:hypothetical protein